MQSINSANSSRLSKQALPVKRGRNIGSTGIKSCVIPAAVSNVRQRVMSASLLKIKNLQNQLNDVQQHVVELSNENRVLRILHKRNDIALSRYESTYAELPQLLNSHSEETRMWQTKYRNLQLQNRDLNAKLKQKDSILLALNDQNKHLIELSNNRHLEDREKLADRVRYLDLKIMEKDEEIKLLTRRLQLQTKNFKTQLTAEHTKYKELNQKFEKYKLTKNSPDQDHRNSNNKQMKNINTIAYRMEENLLPLQHKPIENHIDHNFAHRQRLDSIRIENLKILQKYPMEKSTFSRRNSDVPTIKLHSINYIEDNNSKLKKIENIEMCPHIENEIVEQIKQNSQTERDEPAEKIDSVNESFGEPSSEEPSGEEPSGEEPSGEEPSGEEPSGEEPILQSKLKDLKLHSKNGRNLIDEAVISNKPLFNDVNKIELDNDKDNQFCFLSHSELPRISQNKIDSVCKQQQKRNIDPIQKTKLLQTLKAIDANKP